MGRGPRFEVDPSGRPTPLSAALHVEAESTLMGATLGVETRTDIALPGARAVWAFEDGSLVGAVYEDGTTTLGGGTPPVSIWPAIAVGDSTTEGADIASPLLNRWTTLLGLALGKTIENRGASGARAEEITARTAGLTISGTVSGGIISP